MSGFHPFADETWSKTIESLSVENRVDRVSIYGDIDITRDRVGLVRAQSLKVMIDALVASLENAKDLPDHISVIPPTKPRNPWG